MRSINRCGRCKNVFDYPLIKVPLGPFEVSEEDEEANAMGLDVKSGYALYSSFCLPCAFDYLARLDEDDLRNK